MIPQSTALISSVVENVPSTFFLLPSCVASYFQIALWLTASLSPLVKVSKFFFFSFFKHSVLFSFPICQERIIFPSPQKCLHLNSWKL